MSTSQPPNNSILTLSAPHPTQAITPVFGADCGVPILIYDDNPLGLLVAIYPALAGTVEDGDIIELMLNGQIVVSRPYKPGEENAIVHVHIPHGLIPGDQLSELFFFIRRNSDNIAKSPTVTLRYNQIPPAGKDASPGDGEHSGMELLLPREVLEKGVDAETAKKGVRMCFRYPYCRPRDQIKLSLNGFDILHTVGTEAPAKPTAAPTRICITLYEADFLSAGDSPNFVVNYSLADDLTNRPKPMYSASQTIDVSVAKPRPAGPELLEIKGDLADDKATIDLSKLQGNDLTMQVKAVSPEIQAGDILHMEFRIESRLIHTEEVEVTDTPSTLETMVPNRKIMPVGAEVTARYGVESNGNIKIYSETTTATIIEGETVPAPTITHLLDKDGTSIGPGGQTSDPLARIHGTATPGATVTVFDHGKPIGTALADPVTGVWSLGPNEPLGYGAHVITAQVTSGGVPGPVSEAFFFTVTMESEKSYLIWSFRHKSQLGNIPVDIGPITLRTEVINGNPANELSGFYIGLFTGTHTPTQNGSQKLIIKLKEAPKSGCVIGFLSYAIPAESSGVHVGEINFLDKSGISIDSHQIYAFTLDTMFSKTFVMPDEKRFSEIVITQFAAPPGRRRHWFLGPIFLGDAKSLPIANI